MQTGKAVTSGVVLRVTDTKETDRILTVLTPDRGKIPLIARGARRKNSRLAAACQMPVFIHLKGRIAEFFERFVGKVRNGAQ